MILYDKALRWFLRKTFSVWERLGFHVTPVSFLQPIPDTRTLDERILTRQSELPGLDMREDAQLQMLEELSARFHEEYDRFPRKKPSGEPCYFVDNGSLEAVDGEIYYGLVRRYQPRVVIEIGAGYSTMVAAQALLKNQAETGIAAELTAIEPYPRPFLRDGFPGLSRLVCSELQAVPLEEFTRLGANDMLFIDSSHVLKMGSDVQYEFLEILPRLRPGVIVHVHDIFLPAEYPREWLLKQQWFYNEQYLLQAFLAQNPSWEILWGGSFMHLRHPDRLEAAIKSYDRQSRWPGSFWMRRV